MNKLNKFRQWLVVDSSNIEEMATFNFGKNKGVDHTQVDPNYLQWMQKQLAMGKSGGFNVTDQGRRLNPDELNTLISQHLASGASSAPAASTTAKAAPRRQPTSRSSIPAPAPEGMKEVPKPSGWVGPFDARFDDREGKFKKGDKIYWNGKKGAEGLNMPAFVPEDTDIDELMASTYGGAVEVELGSDGSKLNRPTPEEVRLPPEHMTPYNQSIQDKFLNTNEDIMVDALAGTGKTTMLKHLASFIKPGEKWLYLVYNTKNRDEATQQFPVGRDENGKVVSSVTVMTTHGFLGAKLKNVDPTLGGRTNLPKKGQEDKINIIADQIPKTWPESSSFKNNKGNSPFHGKAKFKAVGLASLAKAYAVNPEDPDVMTRLSKIVEDYNVDMDCSLSSGPPEWQNLSDETVQLMTKEIVEKAVELLRATLPGSAPENEKLGWLSNYRDQDDTLWYTAMFADQINWQTGYHVVLMDEVQDFNMCQMIMAKKLKEAGSRVIAVGDPNQSMYRFRGADAEAFEKLKAEIGGGESESLPINFRSGGNIIDWVKNNTHVENLQAAPHLEGQGEVWADGGTHPPVGYEDFMGMAIEEMQQNGKFANSTAMIARNNAPLAVAAMGFLRSGVDFEIVGLDLSKELVALVEETVANIKDESGKATYVKWEQRQGRNGKVRTFPVPNLEAIPLEEFAMTFLPEFIRSRSAMWRNSASKRDKLKTMRSTASVLQYIWSHIQNPDSLDEEAKKIANGNVSDLVRYLKDKLGGKDPENKQDMAKLSQKDPKSFVTLTTAHKSKGLEWDRIFLMQPGAYDPEGDKIRTEADAQQEKNSWYVAATRGRNVLMVSSDEEPKSGGDGDDDVGGDEGDLSKMFKMMLKR